MRTLEETMAIATRAYHKAGKEGKASLIEVFGEEQFARPRWEDITTLELAFAAAGLSQTDPRFTAGTPDDISYQTLKLVIVPAINEGKVMDYEDEDQEKFWPVFYLNKPGFRFCHSCYDVVDTYLTGGSRLAFASRAQSDHAAKFFLEVFRNFYC